LTNHVEYGFSIKNSITFAKLAIKNFGMPAFIKDNFLSRCFLTTEILDLMLSQTEVGKYPLLLKTLSTISLGNFLRS